MMGDEQREHGIGEHLSLVWELREERVDRSVGCPVGFLFPNSIRRKINLFLDCYTGLSCPTDNLNPGIESLS